MENEHKDNEKVLYKTGGKLYLAHAKSEEADCFVIESHVIIDGVKQVKIPAARIDDFCKRIS